jgi:hypothetical protein
MAKRKNGKAPEPVGKKPRYFGKVMAAASIGFLAGGLVYHSCLSDSDKVAAANKARLVAEGRANYLENGLLKELSSIYDGFSIAGALSPQGRNDTLLAKVRALGNDLRAMEMREESSLDKMSTDSNDIKYRVFCSQLNDLSAVGGCRGLEEVVRPPDVLATLDIKQIDGYFQKGKVCEGKELPVSQRIPNSLRAFELVFSSAQDEPLICREVSFDYVWQNHEHGKICPNIAESAGSNVSQLKKLEDDKRKAETEAAGYQRDLKQCQASLVGKGSRPPTAAENKVYQLMRAAIDDNSADFTAKAMNEYCTVIGSDKWGVHPPNIPRKVYGKFSFHPHRKPSKSDLKTWGDLLVAEVGGDRSRIFPKGYDELVIYCNE